MPLSVANYSHRPNLSKWSYPNGPLVPIHRPLSGDRHQHRRKLRVIDPNPATFVYYRDIYRI